MITEGIQQPNATYAAPTKYYQFSTILEHVIDCFHTIVTDESNPYHPPLAWLTRKQSKPADHELFLDLHDECSKLNSNHALSSSSDSIQLSSGVRSRLEKCPQQLRQEIASRTRDGCSPLFVACRNGLTRVVKYLLDVCGADVEQRGRFEAPEDHHVHSVAPIWVAAVSGHLDTVKLLIDRNANVNSLSDSGSTPLRSVCFLCKDEDGIMSVEEYDNFRHDDYSFGAAPEEENSDIYLKIVYLLVESGADIQIANYSGGTCLINSLHNYNLTNYMISRGADVNASDNQSKTALHYAIQQNRVAVTRLLLANGADPFLQTKNSDDGLRLCCIGGHEEIFKLLIEDCDYDVQRISDAYKLLGSSILEIHYDLARVRKYWTESIKILECKRPESSDRSILSSCATMGANLCDTRRMKAYSDVVEFNTESVLQSLTVDDFRIQSLLISERILGSNHRETIQRLLYRGTFYINSLRPGRCLDLWIYALKLRLENDSIFNFESIFAAQAITKLFLDLFGQRQHQQVRFEDVYDVLSLLIGCLEECERHLSLRPRWCLHEDIYDLLLNMIVNLALVMRCVRRDRAQFDLANKLIEELVRINPRTSNGSSLLHICVAPSMFEGEVYRSLQIATEAMKTASPTNIDSQNHLDDGPPESLTNSADSRAPVVQLIESLVNARFDVDLANRDGLSALQVLCFASSIRVTDRARIVELLVRCGAHVDRRSPTPERDEQIRQTLRECGIKPFSFVTLKCLAARRVSELKLSFDKTMLASNLKESIAIH